MNLTLPSCFYRTWKGSASSFFMCFRTNFECAMFKNSVSYFFTELEMGHLAPFYDTFKCNFLRNITVSKIFQEFCWFRDFSKINFECGMFENGTGIYSIFTKLEKDHPFTTILKQIFFRNNHCSKDVCFKSFLTLWL